MNPGLDERVSNPQPASKEAAMNVKAILAAKVSGALGGDIISIEPTADLTAAAQLLARTASARC